MKISDRTLAVLLVASILLSFSLSLLSMSKLRMVSSGITGYVISNSTGVASVNISSTTSVVFAINTVDFGNGTVNTAGGFNNCTLWINGSSTITKTGCSGFFSSNPGVSDSFVIENSGNVNIAVTINSTSNATSFIGGNASIAKYMYTLSENESGSCVAGFNTTLYAWSDVKIPDVLLCSNLSYVDTADSLRLGIFVTIPNDAQQGNKNNTFTVIGTS